MSRERRPTAAELELWRRAMGEAPAPREPPPPAPPPSAPPPERKAPAKPQRRADIALDPSGPVDLDRRTWLRLKRGQLSIDLKLDLHGQTQDQAHERLGRVLAVAQAGGQRCVLVVTGKGPGGDGVLRRMVPRWLNEAGTRERVVAFCPAQPRHGGGGALYVLLRRRTVG